MIALTGLCLFITVVIGIMFLMALGARDLASNEDENRDATQKNNNEDNPRNHNAD